MGVGGRVGVGVMVGVRVGVAVAVGVVVARNRTETGVLQLKVNSTTNSIENTRLRMESLILNDFETANTLTNAGRHVKLCLPETDQTPGITVSYVKILMAFCSNAL